MASYTLHMRSLIGEILLFPDSSRRVKRKLASKPKRQHTAYTMFVQENYDAIKKNHAEMPSKDIIAMVARQWGQISEEEKELWKQRAVATHTAMHEMDLHVEMDDVFADEDDKKKKRLAGPSKKVKSTAEV